MNITELKEQIIKNTLSNFYIFTGEEISIINIYLEQMSNKLNMPITRADSVLSIYSACTTKPMFGCTRGFYVIRNDNDFPKQEKVYETIEKDIKDNVIVLLYEKVDSRLKFAKHFKDQIVQFDKLSPSVLKSYIVKASGMSGDNAELLATLCNGSYDLAMLECDKIKQYAQGKSVDASFKDLLDCGVIYQPEESDVFKFADAVCSRNIREAFRIERCLRDSGSSSINLLGTLYNSMKSLMLIQCCNSGSVCEVTGLDNRQVYFNKKYAGNYSVAELVQAVKVISRVISGVKSGWIEDSYATLYALNNIM